MPIIKYAEDASIVLKRKKLKIFKKLENFKIKDTHFSLEVVIIFKLVIFSVYKDL
jgi:hypothetical protein